MLCYSNGTDKNILLYDLYIRAITLSVGFRLVCTYELHLLMRTETRQRNRRELNSSTLLRAVWKQTVNSARDNVDNRLSLIVCCDHSQHNNNCAVGTVSYDDVHGGAEKIELPFIVLMRCVFVHPPSNVETSKLCTFD